MDKAGITESIHVPHTGDSDCKNPNCVGAKAEDIIFNNGLNRTMVEEVIESCLKIFVEKQKKLIL